jgi:CubicO group peptidase (beta-lactamase class C family)
MKRLANLIVLVVVLLSASSSVTGQSVDQNPRVSLKLLQVWLDAQRAYQQIPGVSAAVVYDQQLLWSAGFGYADLSHKRCRIKLEMIVWSPIFRSDWY